MKKLPLGRLLPAGAPDVPSAEPHGEIGAQGVVIVEPVEVVAVQDLHVMLQVLLMLPPLLHGGAVAGDPDRHEDLLPERLHGRLLGTVREHQLRPGRGRQGPAAPGEIAPHAQLPIPLHILAVGPVCPLQPAGVHVLEVLRIGGGQVQEAGAALGIVRVEPDPILRDLVKGLLRGAQIPHAAHGVVGPGKVHQPRPGVVGGLGAEPGEGSLVHLAGDDHVLTLLHVHAHPHQQIGVFLQFVFKCMHFSFPF